MGTEGLNFFFNGKEVETKENEWRGKNGTSEWVRDEDRNGHEKSFFFSFDFMERDVTWLRHG